nr:hypothetical protein [Angustibacter aerolatus]
MAGSSRREHPFRALVALLIILAALFGLIAVQNLVGGKDGSRWVPCSASTSRGHAGRARAGAAGRSAAGQQPAACSRRSTSSSSASTAAAWASRRSPPRAAGTSSSPCPAP